MTLLMREFLVCIDESTRAIKKDLVSRPKYIEMKNYLLFLLLAKFLIVSKWSRAFAFCFKLVTT